VANEMAENKEEWDEMMKKFPNYEAYGKRMWAENKDYL